MKLRFMPLLKRKKSDNWICFISLKSYKVIILFEWIHLSSNVGFAVNDETDFYEWNILLIGFTVRKWEKEKIDVLWKNEIPAM